MITTGTSIGSLNKGEWMQGYTHNQAQHLQPSAAGRSQARAGVRGVNCMNIRRANCQDAQKIAELMKQLGYEASRDLIERKLTAFGKTPIDTVFVAESEGTIIGVISCHITSLFHQEGSSGRITSLVIDKENRGLGVGMSLVQQAEEFFHASGCIKSEITSGDHRPEAHSFYESCGYKLDERRFIKQYS